MAKMVEVKLHTITCEFATNGPYNLGGQITATTFNQSEAVLQSAVLHVFSDGPFQMREGDAFAVDRDVRLVMFSLEDPDNNTAAKMMKIGANLSTGVPRTLSDWLTLGTEDIINQEPYMWHLYFGRGSLVLRADISTVYAHHL